MAGMCAYTQLIYQTLTAAIDITDSVHHWQLGHALDDSGYNEPEIDCTTPAFDVVSSDLAKYIRSVESPFPPPYESAWFCKHCSEYIIEHAPRAVVIAHVQQT